MNEDDRGVNEWSLDAVYRSAIRTGERRLNKSWFATAISGFIAGFYVTFGGLVALAVSAVVGDASGSPSLGWLMGSMFYPLGFLFVVLGRSELFTENFLHPVLAVWEGHGRHADLWWLWIVGFFFNLVGVLVIVSFLYIGGLVRTNELLGDLMIHEVVHRTETAMAYPLWTVFWKAVFAGLFINFMSWLIAACREDLAKFIVVWITTFPIMLLDTFHAVVGSSEMMLGMLEGAAVSPLTWFVEFLIPVAAGNHVGGVVFVAALHYLQLALHRRGRY